MNCPLVFGLAAVVVASHASAATTPDCAAPPKLGANFLADHIAHSAIAFQAEVIAAEPQPAPGMDAFDQTVTFRVLHAWKGPNHTGDIANLTLHVVNVCAGRGCVFPFKTGEVTLILSSSSRSHWPEGFGCWRYDGVEIRNILWTPIP